MPNIYSTFNLNLRTIQEKLLKKISQFCLTASNFKPVRWLAWSILKKCSLFYHLKSNDPKKKKGKRGKGEKGNHLMEKILEQ